MSARQACINSCEDLVDHYLITLADHSWQKKEWFQNSPAVFTFSDLVEGFITDYLRLLECYPQFENISGCKSLEELYKKVRLLYGNIEFLEKTNSEEALFSDPRWIEVKNLSEETIRDLRTSILK